MVGLGLSKNLRCHKIFSQPRLHSLNTGRSVTDLLELHARLYADVYRQIHDAMDDSSVCAGAFESINYGECIGMDAAMMSDTCMNTLAPILSLGSADVTKAASAWTAIHEACVAITDAVCALAWYLWHKCSVGESVTFLHCQDT